jgi:hypothetical protein
MLSFASMRVAASAAVLLAAPASAWAAPRPVLGVAAEERVDDGALPQGGTELMSKVSPELGLELKSEAQELQAVYGADLIYHLVAGNLGVDHRARLAYKDAPNERLKLHADGLVYRVEDSSTLPRFGVARVRSPALWLNAGAGAEVQLSPRDAVGLSYALEATRLYSTGLPLASVHALSPKWTHHAAPRLELGAGYRIQLFTAGSASVAQGHALTGSLRYALARHTFLTAEVGPALFSAGGVTRVVPRFGAQVGYEARGVEVGLLGGRDIVGAAGYAAAIWADYLQLGAAWKVSRTLSLDAAGGLYRNGFAPAGPPTAQGWGAGAGLEWRFARGLAAGASFHRISQNGTGAALELSRNIASVRLAVRLP